MGAVKDVALLFPAKKIHLTVHISVQPEDAGVWESQRPSQPVTPLLPSLLLQPATVRDARLLLDLKTPINIQTDVPSNIQLQLSRHALTSTRAAKGEPRSGESGIH